MSIAVQHASITIPASQWPTSLTAPCTDDTYGATGTSAMLLTVVARITSSPELQAAYANVMGRSWDETLGEILAAEVEDDVAVAHEDWHAATDALHARSAPIASTITR